MPYYWKNLLAVTALSTSLLFAGCARPVNPDNPIDPYEKVNRVSYAFNHALDSLLFRPLATTYVAIAPTPIRAGVTNFFNNFEDVTTVANDVLQARFKQAYADTWRVAFNSTLGIGGLLDVSTKLKLDRHYEDFGLTLAYWGQTESAYLDIPIVGPTTFRDGFGKLVDLFALSPWPYIRPMSTTYALYAAYLLDVRSQLLPANQLIADAFDPYVFVRDAYLQTRNKLVALNNAS